MQPQIYLTLSLSLILKKATSVTSLRSYISSTALITISFITGSNFYTWPRHDDFVTLDKVDSFLAHYWHFECFSWEHSYEFLALFQGRSLTISNWQWTGHLIWGSCTESGVGILSCVIRVTNIINLHMSWNIKKGRVLFYTCRWE